jgi:hypothetical protein
MAAVDGLFKIGVPGGAMLVSWALGSVAALGASLGVGAINFGSAVSTGQSILTDYSGKAQKLESSEGAFQTAYDGGNKKDDAAAEKFIQDVVAAMNALTGS